MVYFNFKLREKLYGSFEAKMNLQRIIWVFFQFEKCFFPVWQALIIDKILKSNIFAPTCFICFDSQVLRNSQPCLCFCWYHNTVFGKWLNMSWYIEGEGGSIQFFQYLLGSVTCERNFDLEKTTTGKRF